MNETSTYDSISCRNCRQTIDELEESEVYWTLRARHVYAVDARRHGPRDVPHERWADGAV